MIDSPSSNVRFYFSSVKNCCNRSGMLTVTLQAELAGMRHCWWNQAEKPICKRGLPQHHSLTEAPTPLCSTAASSAFNWGALIVLKNMITH